MHCLRLVDRLSSWMSLSSAGCIPGASGLPIAALAAVLLASISLISCITFGEFRIARRVGTM